MGRARWVGVAVGLWAVAWAACDGQLDFGRGPGGVGGMAGGAAGPGGGGATAGTGGGCTADADCRLANLHCDAAQGGTCVECTTNAHCTRPGAMRCDAILHRCVACASAGDCPSGQVCVGARCITTCTGEGTSTCPAGTSCESGLCDACEADDAEDCAAFPATPYCLEASRVCVGCLSDTQCGSTTPRCDPVKKACVVCVSAADCSADAPYCDPGTGTCAAR